MIPIEDARLDLFEKTVRRGDHHVVDFIVNSSFENVACVYNLPYPAGKPEGWGLIGGRSESFSAVDVSAFIADLDPAIRGQYKKLFERSGNQWTEPPECTAIREAFEEFRVRIRFLAWCEDVPIPGSKRKIRILTQCKEGIVLNPDREISRIIKSAGRLKQKLGREPTANEIETNLDWRARRDPTDLLKQKLGREPTANEIETNRDLLAKQSETAVHVLARWHSIIEPLKEYLGHDPAPDEIKAELMRKNEEESRPYFRTIFFCVAMNHGNPKTQARSPEGPLQTREARWFPIDAPPAIESEPEKLERIERKEPPPEHAYFTHIHMIRDSATRELIEQIKSEPDIGAEPGEDIETLRFLWKNPKAS
ncbi:MAG: hypothetical protein HYT22_02240 [Candidatus Niyogibacteria bacterium]|nr:hypothetical protein [Candidatus Niyogibacteria bacterium]